MKKIKEIEDLTPHKDTIIAAAMAFMTLLDVPSLEYLSDLAAEWAEFRKEIEKND